MSGFLQWLIIPTYFAAGFSVWVAMVRRGYDVPWYPYLLMWPMLLGFEVLVLLDRFMNRVEGEIKQEVDG